MFATLILPIAPIFLLIVLGHLLRRGGIPSFEFWNLNDKLVYWVLFPCLLFNKIATLDFSGGELGELAVAVYAGFAAAILFSLLLQPFFRGDKPLWTSILQGCARHNTFIALAVAEQVFGGEILGKATLVTALLIPVTNIAIVSIMAVALARREGGSLLAAVLKDLARNPLLIAVGLGFVCNGLGLEEIPVVTQMTTILGAAALPIVLLCVGANIRVKAMAADLRTMSIAVIGKMVVFPAGILTAGMAIGLDESLFLAAMLFGLSPTAASAYTLARAMGGDAPAMAGIVTVQTAISFLSMPASLLLLQYLLAQ
ncbi:AEC family transporter [Nisaea acidiphila]|uniref:AEC family transporter n=1 Tax=Nisaea acidiphila TaxID=1862145 RepID=A0A9J7AVP0_9PROT|nr:AEC family transporter [Nisaea acidiphila]UUX51399.1 AEC family transporter [Nisaea acidiphila]